MARRIGPTSHVGKTSMPTVASQNPTMAARIPMVMNVPMRPLDLRSPNRTVSAHWFARAGPAQVVTDT
jgi:hypothetical protein